MFEYKIRLNYRIENCACCPFRREEVIYENVESQDKITGVISITKRQSICTLKDKVILYNQVIENFNSDCPLKNNVNVLN